MTFPLPPFRTNKPFYPLVMNYLATLHGFTDLAARGALLDFAWLRKLGTMPPILAEFERLATGLPAYESDEVDALRAQLKTLTQPWQLASQVDRPIEVNWNDVAQKSITFLGRQIERINESNSSLLIVAHAVTQGYRDSHPEYKNHPLWEFLFHCRNAAAHGGRFNLLKFNQPKHPSVWGPLEVKASDEGRPLFYSPTEPTGMLKPADPIYLLFKIEMTFPDLA